MRNVTLPLVAPKIQFQLRLEPMWHQCVVNYLHANSIYVCVSTESETWTLLYCYYWATAKATTEVSECERETL